MGKKDNSIIHVISFKGRWVITNKNKGYIRKRFLNRELAFLKACEEGEKVVVHNEDGSVYFIHEPKNSIGLKSLKKLSCWWLDEIRRMCVKILSEREKELPINIYKSFVSTRLMLMSKYLEVSDWAEFKNHKECDLRKLRNVGKGTVDELKYQLKIRGLNLE